MEVTEEAQEGFGFTLPRPNLSVLTRASNLVVRDDNQTFTEVSSADGV